METSESAWAGLAHLKPTLRSHVEFYQHDYRGQQWHILSDPLSGAHFRCNEIVFRFVECLDGQHSIERAYQSCLAYAAEHAPTREDILKVLATLQTKELLHDGIPVSGRELFQRREEHRVQQTLRKWSRPLAFKVSLWDPDQWLNKFSRYLRPLFNRWILALFSFLILIGGVAALSHWSDLTQHFSERFLDPQNLLMLWLLYPCIKFVHELGHAFTTKHWGGEVHDLGVLFLVMIPVPYVDASSSHQFQNKYQRMLVAAAGIIVELLLASVALLWWVNLTPGLARDIAFNIAVIGGLSTLFINGNPLLRFDGYYVFSDAIEVPNLASRSTQYLGYLSQKLLFGLDNLRSPVSALGEPLWLFFYGILSGLYRWFISFSIALFVASSYFVIGVILALWFLVQQMLWPMFLALKALISNAYIYKRQRQLIQRGGLLLVAVWFIFFLLPVKSVTHVEGIITLPEDAIIRAGVDGFMQSVQQPNGKQVDVNTPLFVMENPDLDAKKRLIKAQLTELKARASEALIGDRFNHQIIQQEIIQTSAALNDIQEKIGQLTVKSSVKGRFEVSTPLDMPGRFYRKGEVLAHVLDLSEIFVNAVIPQDAIAKLSNANGSIVTKLHSRPDTVIKAFMGREVPQATNLLPSAQLGSASGGVVRVDARDATGLKTIDAVYQVELGLDSYSEDFLAAKVSVKIHHQGETVSTYIYRRVSDLISDHLSL